MVTTRTATGMRYRGWWTTRGLGALVGIALVIAGAAVPLQAQSGTEWTYGTSVAVGNGVIFVAEPGNVVRSGIVYAYRADGGRWVEAARVTAPQAESGDGFGAAIAAQGDLLLASQPGAADDRGAVYVYERQGDSWRNVGRITADGGAAGDSLGTALALDGDRAVVAAKNAAGGVGAVYVFRRAGDGRWAQEAVLTGSGASATDAFGSALAVRGDRVVVGAPGAADTNGAVYVFERDESDRWAEIGKLVAQDAAKNDRLGAAVAIMGDLVLGGAPGGGGLREYRRPGAVHVFSGGVDSWRYSRRLVPFADQQAQMRFGAGLAVVADELWVAAPMGSSARGTIYRLRIDPATGAWTRAETLSFPNLRGSSLLANTFAASAELAVAALPHENAGRGGAAIFAHQDGEWTPQQKVQSEPEIFATVTGGQVDCGVKRATIFPCQHVDLLAFLPIAQIGGKSGIALSDVWGWTDPDSGREYAIVARSNGTSFIDISDAENPVYLGDLPLTAGARARIWRDMKVHANHVYIVADAAGQHGMQVFDLTRLRNVQNAPVTFEVDAHYDRIHSAHNIVINEETGFAYMVGANGGETTCGGGLHMVDIRDPRNPTFAGCFADPQTGRKSTGYTHDAQCVIYRGPDRNYTGREICLGSNETAFSIADVTAKANPVAIARASYPNVGYAHQGWLTDDHRYFYMNDELDETNGLVPRTRTLIWDVAELDDPQLVGEFSGTTAASDHNLYIVGDLMYQSNYKSGLRVIDISDRLAPREVGYFDTAPQYENKPGFSGSWSNYPYFRSGVIVVTSMGEGVFLLKVRKPAT